MPLIPRPTLGIGVGQRTTRNVILTAGIALFVMMGVAVVGLRIGRQVLASGSPVAAGVLMIGLVTTVFFLSPLRHLDEDAPVDA